MRRSAAALLALLAACAPGSDDVSWVHLGEAEAHAQRIGGIGLALAPGARWEPGFAAEARLAFSFTVASPGGGEVAPPVVTVGEAVLEPARVGGAGAVLHLSFVVPRGEQLTVENPSGDEVLLLDPVIGPVDVGAPGARPFDVRPDVVLLVADTFRADNLDTTLAVGAASHALTPALRGLAAESVRFSEARAAATWTLPSHAALFAARYAPEIGVQSGEDRLGDDVVTLAERFRDAGYRTVGITDGGYVSAAFGVAQGFAHYETVASVEEPDLDATQRAVERALERDDGRPLFLFVHSYRAHAWVVDESTRRRLDGALTFQPNATFRSADWRARLLDLMREAPHGAPLAGAEYDEVVAAMAPNYRGASAATDEGFGNVLGALESRGGLERAVVVFTSDHGESLGEHGVVSHGNGVWDPQARVPLLVRAPGLAPRTETLPAGLVDLPRTLAALTGVAPAPDWAGIDLFGDADRDRPLFVHQTLPARTRYVAAIHDGWKLVFLDDGGPRELLFAYDLRSDPSERENRVGDVDGTPREAAARAALEALVQGRADAAQPSAAVRRQLEGLGYTAPDSSR